MSLKTYNNQGTLEAKQKMRHQTVKVNKIVAEKKRILQCPIL